MRPVHVRPKYGSYPTVVAVMLNGSLAKSSTSLATTSFSASSPSPSPSPPYQCNEGAGMSCKIASNNPLMQDTPSCSTFSSPPLCAISNAASTSSVTHPPLALPNNVLYSICSAVASKLSNKSIKSNSVSPPSNLPRLSNRSALLRTTIGTSPSDNARDRTYFVWDLGPSPASTTRTMPSTVERTRSTSPAKSACPGVSTTLMTWDSRPRSELEEV
mmetsp:Transcript_32673/g.70536  ORF Transcript_32673/g.70536 Transcript_32673/m.70536 type:complete len:216 (-) Transcript_32673:563-1210(-)